MFKRLKPKSEFSRNVLTLMTGTTIAQAIPIAISPILTRIYTPEDFGTYAAYLSIALILIPISMFRYEQAIMLPKSDIDALALFKLSFNILIYFMTFIAFIFTVIAYFNHEINVLLLLVSYVMMFISAIISLNSMYLNRKKSYKILSKILIYSSVVNAILNIGIGFITHSPLILLVNIMISKIVSAIQIIKIFISYLRTDISKELIYDNFKRYNDMLKFSTPSALIQSINRNILTIYLTTYFDPALAGGYFLIQRVFGAPIGVFSSSFGQVFFENFTNSTNKYKLLYKVWLKLIAIVVPVGILLFFTIKPILLFVFGGSWLVASNIALIVLPYFMIYAIFSSTSRSHITLRLQHISLLFTIVDFVVRMMIMFYGTLIDDGLLVIKLFVIYDIIQMILMNIIVAKRAKNFQEIENKG